MLSAIPQILEEKIAAKGAINLAEYMSTCLYEPEHGYYMTRDPFGLGGDFTTAPEVSGLFGEMIAAWLIDTWTNMDSPSPFNLVEAGPGRGTLMNDILSMAKNISPAFYEAANTQLVEISPFLSKVQQVTLSEHQVEWHENIAMINFDLPTLFIGNELLDAFPVRQFKRVKHGYVEQMVTFKDGQFKLMDDIHVTQFDCEFDKVETCEAMLSFLKELKSKIQQGVCLFLDYGSEVNASESSETLQALKNHQKVDILETPGEADLTTHVNFTKVQQVLGENTSEAIPMGPWMIHLGLAIRAASVRAHMDEEERNMLEEQVRRLVHPEEMGMLFKAITWQKGYNIELEGFQKEDEAAA